MGVIALKNQSVDSMNNVRPVGNKSRHSTFIFHWELIPFFLIAFVIPVIVLRIPVAYNSEMRSLIATAKGYEDYFHFIKVWVLYGASIMLFLAFLLKKAEPLPRLFGLFIPYILMIIVSVCFSKTIVTAAFGMADHYEGALTQICYALIFIFSFYFADSEDRILIAVKLVLWGSAVVALVGLLQLAGSPLINSLIPGEGIQFAAVQGKADVSGITATIGNSNYTGTYAVLLIPLSVLMVLREKRLPHKILSMIVYFGSAIFLLFVSLSRAGYISFLAVCPMMVIFFWKSLKKQFLWVLAALTYASFIFIAINTATQGILLKEVQSLNPFAQKVSEEAQLVFQDIRLDEDTAVIETNQWTLAVQREYHGFRLEDEAGNLIPSVFDESSQGLILTEKPYQEIRAWIQRKDEVQWILLEMGGKDIEFVHTGQSMKVVGFNSVLADIVPVETFTGIQNESFASGRGYIWSRSIPLLKNALLWGYGPDTFAYIFPQNDFVGKLNYGSIWVIIGKPHNWYLQVALGSGVLSLVCLLAFFGWFIIKSVLLHLRFDQGERTQMAFAVLASVIGYLIISVFNDSVVSVSPILWMLCGFGVRLEQPIGKHHVLKQFANEAMLLL